jgi:ATP-binding cassette subfamily F protein 3
VESSTGDARTAPRGSAPKTKGQKRAEAEARNRAYRTGRPERARLSAIEEEMTAAEARDAELLALLAQPDLYADKVAFDRAMAEYGALKSRRQAMEVEWLELTDTLERLEPEAEPKTAKAPRRRHRA